MNTGLQQYIIAEILPKYDSFDAAHRRNHINMVVSESLRLGALYHLNEDMVYTIASYHDLGLCGGRERHHIISREILLSDKNLLRWFSAGQIITMADAVEDHRASSKSEPRSIYGKVLAEADRSIDPATILLRTVEYGMANYPELDKEGHFLRMKQHLMEKYAEGGYFKLLIPESGNSAALEELRAIIRDPGRLHEEFEKIWGS